MLDIETYRQCESIAKQSLENWNAALVHNIDHWESRGFPVRVKNSQELRALLAHLQEDVFEQYMQELGGLSDQELDLFLQVLEDVIEFQSLHFPNKPAILPFRTLMATHAIYQKLCRLKPGFRTILEIGPGAGYLAFFLHRYNSLQHYVQVEACESYYLLQNYMDLFLFGSRFDQKAFLPWTSDTGHYFPTHANRGNELTETIWPTGREKICTQYPWWRLGDLAADSEKYDIITSNANMLEFSPVALNDYLCLIDSKLNQDGLLFIQDLGEAVHGSAQDLLERLYESGLAPLFIVPSSFSMPKILSMPSPSERRKIVFAPAGNNTLTFLNNDLIRSLLRDFYDRIYILDNLKHGRTVHGYDIISKEELKALHISDGVVLNNDPEIVRVFTEIFAKLDIRTLPVKVFSSFNGLFINRSHRLFQQQYDHDNYSPFYFANIDLVGQAFFTEEGSRTIHTREEILNKISNIERE